MSALTDTVKGLGKSNAGAMLVLGLILIIGGILFALHSSTANFAPLYTGLSLEDSAKIVAELEKTNTPNAYCVHAWEWRSRVCRPVVR